MSDIRIKPAQAQDAIQCSQVFCDSIRELCVADHNNEVSLIEGWSSNKTPKHILAWIESGSPQLFVAQIADNIVGVGGLTLPNEVSLNYVSPAGVGCGVGRAMMLHLEQALKSQGAFSATLTSTKTAFEFYKHLGWVVDGEIQTCMTVEGYPMKKILC